ncbi:uncharacterized protein LOC105388358 isoform X5 [Plutella xylostella]|uniref:uncharacterized protein LOC105388358 isoform X5 n=1 Tax=Plutella xylostella TaxID=51655 RepID=UPI002032F9F4|nr:uncharacterized protein LOC105388358 isoform X5 [Plutella xylostella]
MSNRNDEDTEDYVETHTEFYSDEIDGSSEDSERGKRQVRHGRHYYKDGSYKNVGKNWASPKPIKYTDIPQYSFNTQSNLQGNRYQSSFNSLNNNNPFEGTRKPFFDENSFSTANPFISFQKDTQSQRPFKASLPDPRQKNTYNPINPATQIITKSPPISSLNSNDNPFASLAGGFYNNNPQQSNSYNYNQQSNKQSVNSNHNNSPSNHNSFDSSHVSSTVVTGKPVLLQTPREPTKYRNSPDITKFYINNFKNTRDQSTNNPFLRPNRLPTKEFENLNNQDDDEENSSEEDASDDDELSNKNVFPKPPYEFTHPGNKYADIQNPFADPNFDFDEFLAKLRGDHEKIRGSTSRPSYNNPSGTKTINSPVDATTSSTRPSKLNYHGMSTPRPFSMPTGASAQWPNENANIQTTTPQSVHYEPIIQRPSQHQDKETYGEQQHRQQQEHFRQQQQNAFSQNIFNRPQQHNSNPLSGPTKTQLKPPNFNDDRQLPINYKFNQALQSNIRTSTEKPQYKDENKNNQLFLGTQKPYVIVTGTGSPIYFTSPKQQYFSTGKPYSVSSFKPQNPFYAVKPSTPKPLTTIANEQLSILQQFWNKKQEEFSSRPAQPTTTSSAISNHQNSYGHGTKSSTPAYNNGKNHFVLAYSPRPASATTKAPSTRKPIPKPSPEMSDYYYDDDEQYYYEPPVKSQYMPSSEVRPQRPKMAQNYQEYEDSDSYEDESPENNQQQPYRRPANYNKYKTDSSTKTYNDITIVVTKAPPKETTKTYIKNMGNSNSSPSPTQNLLNRPEVSNYKVLHYPLRNKTMHIKRPESGPHTMKPPKYLNQTTLRPYTVRHRLAKPTTVQTQMTQTTPSQDMKSTRGRTRHPNIVTQTRLTTPRDSHNQETRYTKTQHDDKTNSLEPTESVTPIQFSPSPRPKMLYNGSQSYNPDQYDPYYAVYDEDGELYKDTDYVQQYNLASLRPAVQQTYRGTPPPARRPVETYTPRPTIASNDYDEEVLQGQINNQNQYQTPLRHSTRGEGNELGFEINPTTGRTTVYEAPITTTPPTTTSTSTTTTTQRPTVAPFTEAMIPSRYSTRPSPTRGRGSAHYSTSGGGAEPPQPAQAPQQTNRGTPPTRSRPTLKPSTSIVSKSTEFVDIYSYPPRRPSAVYPQPTPDKTAAKCRKDVCLLPDCNCGGKEIPGDLPVESVPQIVLLTFDDSVNDLNKVLYQDLFEKGRVNPNGCPISATFYVSHEWTDYSQVQNLYAAGHEMASHTISHSFGEQFSQKKWNREVGGQREILAAYGGVKLEDVRGMRAPFLSVGGNKMFKMLYDSNFTYDSSMPVYENRPPSWPYTLDYKLFHDCMIPPCPTKSYPGVWEVPMVMWQDLNGGRCSMGDACANPPNAEGVYKMLLKNFDRHYTTNRAPFGLFYHAAWFTQPHHKEGFIMFLDSINRMNDVWIVTNWQALQWVRDPTPINRLNNFQPFQCDYPDRPKKCNNPKVCNLWHKSGVRYMRTCQPCPEIYPWTGKTGIRSSRIDNDIEE